jgi:putative ABC transport system permease protein
MQSLKVAFKNVLRNRRRSFTTIVIAAIGTAAMVSAAGFVLFAYDRLEDAATRELGHVMLAQHDYFDKEEEKPLQRGLADYARLRRELVGDERVRAVLPRIQFSGLVSNGDKNSIFIGNAVEPQEFQLRGLLVKVLAGKPLSEKPDAAAEAEVMLGKDLAHIMGAEVGSSLTLLAGTTQGALNAIDVKVRGIFTTGAPDLDKRLIYVQLATAQELLRTNKVSTLSVYLFDTAATEAVMGTIAARLPQLAQKPWWELAFYYKAVRALYNRVFGVLGVILLILVFFSVSNTMSMSVMERTRETGTLAALGSYPYELIRNFVLEALVIGALGVLLGLVLGVAISVLLTFSGAQMPPPPGRSDTYPLAILISPQVCSVVAALVMTTCTSAALFAARRGARKPIVEALAYV